MLNESFFNEFTVELGAPAMQVVDDLARKGVLAGVPLSRLLPNRPGVENLLLIAVTETVTDEDMERLVAVLEEV